MDSISTALTADVAALSHDDRLSALTELAVLRERIDVQEQRLLAAIAVDDASEQDWVCDEIACALTLTPSAAALRLRDARDLARLLPLTIAAMDAGRISARNAAVLLDVVRPLDPELRVGVESQVLDRAAGRTTAEFRRTVRRAVAALDARDLEERHASAAEQRRVTLRPVADGMSELWALLPADGAARLMAAISSPAAPDDVRTGDQRRADALLSLIDPQLTGTPSTRPAGPAILVTVGLDTLLGFDDTAAELAGHGPVPATMARRLAADPSASWRRIVTDSAGRAVDAELTYRPSAALRALIAARDGTCRFPGCSRPARRAEIDHIVAWEDGGPTRADNLQALCSRHHHLKHEAGWSVYRDAGGTTRWRSPTGRRYARPPDDTITEYLMPPPEEVRDAEDSLPDAAQPRSDRDRPAALRAAKPRTVTVTLRAVGATCPAKPAHDVAPPHRSGS